MQVYLVGGAVRDTLLNRPVTDKDFVVVGANPDALLAQGFTQVGADFPVFLHPITHHEYALARLERKTGTGHTAFSIDSRPDVSLKDDLLRRDLTINALAIEVTGLFDDSPVTGEVIDYYGGLDDLAKKRLRHVSPAFCEDALRILRTARFFARFFDLGFSICPTTITVMQQMANQGELSHLSQERLWSESAKAMSEHAGFAYWQCLDELDILRHLLPNLANAWTNTTLKASTLSALAQAHSLPIAWQFALLMSSFVNQPNAHAHIQDCAIRLRAPKVCTQTSLLLLDFVTLFTSSLTADALLLLIEKSKANLNSDTAHLLIDSLYLYQQAHKLPAIVSQDTAHTLLDEAINCYHAVSIKDIDAQLTGADIGYAIKQLRLARLAQFLQHIDTSL